ncbi:hypothetical protein AVEN_254398-1 [Araneus ventricosus]|uniref:RNase H type-1 domain-containing protein n=1 Tax=Araneus ventricosus TaxID=182803 RepID=A0A4Y2IH29_ARAVE|nr:hypothetical protein AVEN_254398-1 [Araneus ventricosus]
MLPLEVITGGVCILTSNLYPSTPLTLHTSLQAVAVHVHARTLVTVCSVYLPPHDVISQQDLDTLVDQLPTPFILLGDFNGHSTLWGSDDTNSRGRQIERFISNNCLCLLNNDEKTYFHEPTRTFHSLDLAICSPTLMPLLDFTVGSDLCNSDHFPLIVSYADSGGAIQYPPRYLFQRADWKKFMQLADVTESMVCTADITESVQNVVDCIINAANNSIPKCSPCLKKFRRPWWNEACRASRREEKKQWNIFRIYPTTENHVAFKRAKALARRIRRRSQRESWINFISSITYSISSKLLWKRVKAANGIYREFSFPVLNTGNVTHSAPLDIANTLGHAFANVSATDSYSPDFVAIKNRAERTPLRFTARSALPYNTEFRMFELETALSRAHDTSPGPDGITYNMLRHLNTTSLSHLLFLFNRIWTEQKYPSQWHEAIVIPILKPGKDPSNPLHYRPIALTSCLCKTLERMVNARLIFELEKQGCISPLQSGFRRDRSTFDNIVLLETQIRNAFVLSKTSWGADRTSLLRIYQAVILSRIDYGCMVYGSARPTVLRRLDTIHHSALRICTGALRTSPVESLYIISHQLPLDSRRQKISALYSFRAQSVRNHPINRLSLPAGLRRLYAARPSHILPLCERTKMLLHDSDLNNVSVQLSDFFTFPPWDSPEFSFLNPFSGFDKSSTAPITFQQLFHHHRCQYSSFVPIFTDGLKSDGHVGCGVVFPSDTLSYRLHNCCSVFTAELVAIFCALQEILPSNQRNFILYTDSMSALETLSHYDNRIHPVALVILSVLQFLRKKGFNIIFCWVPSHVGISGNETADVIARFASDFLPRALPYCDIKKFLVSHLLSVWQQKWNLLTRNKLYPVKPSIGLWPALLMRELDVKLTRLRIGHTRFTHRHLFLGQRAPFLSDL